MRNTKVLEMLESGRIEDLKKELQDEIYKEALKTKPGANKRYAAMKKYFSYFSAAREALQKPCNILFRGKQYNSFINGYTMVLTTEDVGEMELFDNSMGAYPEPSGILRFEGDTNFIDIAKALAEAKANGYKLVTKEVSYGYKYLMVFDGSYYKMGLVDSAYGIINDGKPAKVYKVKGHNKPLLIENELGYCYIMPIRYEGNPDEDGIKLILVDYL